jgi:hypothetical protein
MTNPSASCASNVCTFYARILTFDTAAHSASYNPTGANTGLDDQGGVAISTVTQLVINSKVQEQIQFCIDTNSAATCSAATTSAIGLGDTNDILTTAGPYVSIVPQYIIQTNAQHNAVIYVQGVTLTGGYSGSATIETSSANAAGSSVDTSYASTAAASQFGLCSWELSGSTLTPTAPYSNANCNTATTSAGTGTPGDAGTAQFAFDLTSSGAGQGINSTYGEQIATATSGQSTGNLAFIANIGYSQQPGLYTPSLSFIATGSYC